MYQLLANHRMLFFVAVLALFVQEARADQSAKELPNIVWITAEDMSANLGCYGDAYADTPHLDRFARQSVKYTHAFATAPCCSPARSCLITGVYATSLGTQRLRSEFAIPKRFRGFPELLRKAGYFTTNNVKTDYNMQGEQAFIDANWDRSAADAHWRQRPSGKPFFSVFNLMVTHQSRTSVWPQQQFERDVASKLGRSRRHDPALAVIPPYFPDIPSVRNTLARYYDCISVMDNQVGDLLQQLRDDGLDENTIVIYYSDHGRGIPRGKRVLHDTGLHVPLLIHVPHRFQSLSASESGTTTDRLVSFVDFAPTVLSLAGVPIPTHMQGMAFLGKQATEPRQHVFGARDRVDEVFDVARSVRDQRYLYIRNYMPHLSWMPPERYSDASVMRRDLLKMRSEGKLNALQLTYAAPRRSREELFDTLEDPHQVKNLAASDQHRQLLEKMRTTLTGWQTDTRDLGFLTEPDVLSRFGREPPYAAAANDSMHIEPILAAAGLVGDPTSVAQQAQLLNSPDRAVRYWASVGLRAAGDGADSAKPALRAALQDEAADVRIEVATALVKLGEPDNALGVLAEALKNEQAETVLHAMRSLELLGPMAETMSAEIEAVLIRAQPDVIPNANPCWMFVRFSAAAALEKNSNQD